MVTPEWDKEFILFTDASNIAIGGILSQIRDGKEKVIEYYSKGLSKAEQHWSTTDKEMLALKSSMEHFEKYLRAGETRCIVDHAALLYLANISHLKGKHFRMFEVFNNFNYRLEYRKGQKHINADVMSRNPTYEDVKPERRYANITTNLMARVEIEPEEIIEFKESAIKALGLNREIKATSTITTKEPSYRSRNPDSLYEQVSIALTNNTTSADKIKNKP